MVFSGIAAVRRGRFGNAQGNLKIRLLQDLDHFSFSFKKKLTDVNTIFPGGSRNCKSIDRVSLNVFPDRKNLIGLKVAVRVENTYKKETLDLAVHLKAQSELKGKTGISANDVGTDIHIKDPARTISITSLADCEFVFGKAGITVCLSVTSTDGKVVSEASVKGVFLFQ